MGDVATGSVASNVAAQRLERAQNRTGANVAQQIVDPVISRSAEAAAAKRLAAAAETAAAEAEKVAEAAAAAAAAAAEEVAAARREYEDLKLATEASASASASATATPPPATTPPGRPSPSSAGPGTVSIPPQPRGGFRSPPVQDSTLEYGGREGGGPAERHQIDHEMASLPMRSIKEIKKAEKALLAQQSAAAETATKEAEAKSKLLADRQAKAAKVAEEKAAKEAAVDAPTVSADLVIKSRDAKLHENLVLRVQDTGGQPIFLSILELLTTPAGTVYMIVFSLAKLQEAFEDTVETTIGQLKSIQAFAAGAPLILAGTRKAEVGHTTAHSHPDRDDECVADELALNALSERLLNELQRRCAPAIVGLLYDEVSGRCFFGIENSKGFDGDATIRELVMAIERAAYLLPSMSVRVPLSWLLVMDTLRKLSLTERRVELKRVRQIAKKHGLPSSVQITLDDELSAMLTFFHSLNAVLWYDTPSLRDLVVLDPQWVIDACTCFIRDFKLQDHTQFHERMNKIDQRAIREEPEAWELLTGGKAILKKRLLQLLWSDAEFASHTAALLDLIQRFALAVPVPRKSDEWIVPPLLVDVHPSAPPSAWPHPPNDAAELRIHFQLKGDTTPVDQLFFTSKELEAGFLPDAIFHRIATGALGLSDSSKFESCIERTLAYLVLDKEPVTLRKLPQASSIGVLFHSNGMSGGAMALDRLRVLLSEGLTEYRNLRFCILTPLRESRDDSWVDLDALGALPDTAFLKDARGRPIAISTLKEKLSLWLTQQCEFCFLSADKLRSSTPSTFPAFMRLQDMRKHYDDWMVYKTISFKKACLGDYVGEFLAVSHRWETREAPDTTGAQLLALREYIRSQPQIRYIFFDQCSLPQGGDKTPAEKAAFAQQLPNINLLYLGCRVLILLDRSYSSRFWCSYECWLSFMMATRGGLISADEAKLRCHVECLHGTPPATKIALKEEWLHMTAEDAFIKLGSPDVTVTNESDKQMQLPKVRSMNQLVVELMTKLEHNSAAPTRLVVGTGATTHPELPTTASIASRRRLEAAQRRAEKRSVTSQIAAAALHFFDRKTLPTSSAVRIGSSAGGSGGGGNTLTFMEKVQMIKEYLRIDADAPKAVLAEANQQMGITAEGALPAQAEVLYAAIGFKP
uniref:COR domain-containing protein n=1 Tax=Haptolina brevifila TaxID=156173 RepID=A0A7S2GH12_9EUKA|mmetsp:Transcript_37562/g.75122  ORF Transcript_37562/g.75122 Transcript_37562/m.75122 type:complete len:1150 (+) Transcript_37562:57-3506(+)